MDNQSIDSLSATDSAVSNAPRTSLSRSGRYLILLLATLLIAGGLLFYFYKNLRTTSIDTVIEDIADAPLSGILVMTATLDGLPAPFVLDLETEDALFFKYPSDYDFTLFPEFTNKIDPGKVFFVSSIIDAESEADKLGLSSWVVGIEGVDYYQGAAGNVEKDLNWSEEAGQLAFYRAKTSTEIYTEVTSTINDYEIVIMDPVQNIITAVIDGSIYPRWSPDGKSILFLKEDGFYEYNLDKETETKIMGPEQDGGVLSPSEMFDVSPDGKRLIVTSQNSGLISMFEISFWNPPNPTLEYTFADDGVQFLQPIFSPDGTKFALLAFDRVGDDFFNPRLEIRDADTANILYSRSVEAFDMTKFHISDWIADTISISQQISDVATEGTTE